MYECDVLYSICGVGSHNDQQMTTVRGSGKDKERLGGGGERKEQWKLDGEGSYFCQCWLERGEWESVFAVWRL